MNATSTGWGVGLPSFCHLLWDIYAFCALLCLSTLRHDSRGETVTHAKASCVSPTSGRLESHLRAFDSVDLGLEISVSSKFPGGTAAADPVAILMADLTHRSVTLAVPAFKLSRVTE